MNIEDKKKKIDQAILKLEKLKSLYTIEHSNEVETLKANVRKDIKIVLDKSELFFKSKSQKALYYTYLHFGLFTLFSRKEMTKYLFDTFGMTEGSVRSYITTLYGDLKNTWYTNWRSDFRNEYENHGMVYPNHKYDSLKPNYKIAWFFY